MIPAVRTMHFSVVIAVALMHTSCAMMDEPPIPLPEGRWELLAASFTDTGRIPGVPRATLEIRGARLAAYGGCNNGTGSVAAIDGRMVVEALATTRRACLEPLGGFEGRLFRMLRDKPYFRVENGVLTLAAGDLSARFRRLPETKAAAKPAAP
jgi:heat shock protein HslJ